MLLFASLFRRSHARCVAAVVFLLGQPGLLQATVPVTGQAVPELAILDTTMDNLMSTFNVGAGQLAMMRNGVVIYNRSFGWKNQAHTQALPLDSVFRIASVSKPFTAAAVRKLILDGRFTLNTKVFSLGVAGAGLLDYTPFGTPDSRLKDVTVEHLLQHTGGWDRDIFGDVVFMQKSIAAALGTTSPPGRDNTVRWVMGKPLQHTPGSTYAYSNFGYMLLGLIVEKVSGQNYRDYVYQNVFQPEGVPLNDFIMGRTFAVDQDPREPNYYSPYNATNVFYPTFSNVQTVTWPYGGFDMESFIGFGGTVTNGLTFLRFLNRYVIFGDDIGNPRWGPGSWWSWHSGSLDGTNTAAMQRGDGINYAILFNSRPNSGADYVSQMVTSLTNILDNNQITTWPSKGVLAPSITQGEATHVLATTATLNGEVNAEGTATTVWFDYGLTTSYTDSSPHQNLGSGLTKTSVNAPISGLSEANYHYRLVASNANGTTYGQDQAFTLLMLPSVTSPGPAQLLEVGQPLSLSVTATGSPTLTYQWRRDSNAIPGALSNTYSVASIGVLQGGSYDCVVTNDAGSRTSAACSIGVVDLTNTSSTVNEGATVTRTVPSSGPGLGFAWFKDDQPLGNTLNFSGTGTASLKITGFNADNLGSYFCRISLGVLTLDTQTFNYTSFLKPKVITPPTAAQIVGIGETLTLSVTASGGAPLLYQWRKNNIAIGGATKATYSVTAALGSAGTYDCSVSNTAGVVPSAGAAIVAVADLSGGSVIVNEGGTLSRTVSSSVAGLKFSWLKGIEPVSNAGTTITGATTSKLTVTKFASGNAGSYVCRVLLESAGISRDSAPLVVTMRGKPVVTPFTMPALQVSAFKSFTVEASDSPTKFTITGLPSGMSYVAATGVVSITPNAAAASFTLKISATNVAGTGPLYSVTGSITKLNTKFVGAWNGLLPRDEGLKMSYGGTVNVVPSSSGVISGKAIIGGVSYKLGGRLAALPDDTATLQVPIKRAAPLSTLTLKVTLDANNGAGMTGTITDGTLTSAPFTGWRNTWNAAPFATAYAGAYTAAIQVPSGLTDDYPKGTGYAFLTIGSTGGAAWSGKLADGSAILFSTTISSSGDVPFHQMCYVNKGSAQGWCRIVPDASAPYATNMLDGTLDWLKDKQTAGYTYKAGFAKHSRTLIGGKYAKPTTGLVLGITPMTPTNAQVEFSEGGVSFTQPFLVTAANAASVPVNANTVKLTLTASSGAISGSFVMKNPNPYKPSVILPRTALYYGVLVPRLSQGAGYFVLSQLPDPVGPPITTATTAPVLSGKVVMH